ncbi:hypothetical protein ACSX1A_00685 [Pontibacter sp. MBLB2868]|uniref:hypothetical protein n=1 Tax=Pontibacter sp. MBLB2868 TaxID=3451555 RepID=UPI003F7561CD
MKIQSKFKTIGLALAVGFFSYGCSQEAQNETNEVVDETQAELSDANVEANREFDDFALWVNTNTERAETVTADEYREMRAEYNRREAELEAESSTWDDETKREWEETKSEWNDFENKVQQRLGNIDDVDVDVDVEKNNQ